MLARLATGLENGTAPPAMTAEIAARARSRKIPVIGVTGTGGAGKSSLTDELIRRFRLDRPDMSIAVVAIDPSRRRTGGALLGDRIRMNAINDTAGGGLVYMRSLATRASGSEVPAHVPAIVDLCKAAGFALVIVETPGIGQADAAVDRSRRPFALRDDARVRRRQPAREDRDVGSRRHRGDQQVRAQGRL